MNVEELYQQALECVEQGRLGEARELGHQLLKLRFSGAFEILAKSFHGEGNLLTAIQVLESGVREAPIWPLWLQLGNYRSEIGDLQGALDAYREARDCTGSEVDQILYNEAMMRLRFGNKEKALELFRRVYQDTRDKRLRVVALTQRLTLLVEMDRVTEALFELGEAYLHDSDNAELLSKLAFLLLEKGDLVPVVLCPHGRLLLGQRVILLKSWGFCRLLHGLISCRRHLFEVREHADVR